MAANEPGDAAPETALDAAYDAIVQVRDAFPRTPDDADSSVIAEAVIDRLTRLGFLPADAGCPQSDVQELRDVADALEMMSTELNDAYLSVLGDRVQAAVSRIASS